MLIISNVALLKEFQGLLNNMSVHIFIWAVLFDIFSGIAKGFFIKEANSTKGLLGLVKHLLVVLLVLTAVPYLNLAGMSNVSTWFIWFYIIVYAISITENWGQLNLPLPQFVKDGLSKLHDQTDKGPTKK